MWKKLLRLSRCVLVTCAALLSPKQAHADQPPCGDAADYEPVETRCDGIDNDCDGLVDVLLPVAENECHDGTSCMLGHAACSGGNRVCFAPGPAPEVADGVDNDCNGAVDDVPAFSGRARALLLVPGYLFSDGPYEIDDIASMLDQWGVAYDRPSAPSDFDAALTRLSDYPLVVVPGYLEEDFLVPFRRSALEAYAASGGTLVVFKPVFDAGSATHQLTGTISTVQRTDVDGLAFDGARSVATRAFDSPEERFVPINAPSSGESIIVDVLTPSDPSTAVLASATVGGVPVGAVALRRTVGSGAVYSLGHDLHTSYATRCYVNCFEPGGDLAGLFLRDAMREAMHGHIVLKHTVPGAQDSIALLSHDVDALDAQQPGPEWGEPGALQVAELESQRGARGSYLVTTAYVNTDASVAYYSPDLVQSLCALDMCPVGAHSVVHGADFGTLPLGTCAETAATYKPDTEPTLCGEVRVSLELLTSAMGKAPVAWRSPYLYVNPALYDVLASNGILYDSSYAVGDLKSNLPVSLTRTGMAQDVFHARPLYSMPISLEDGIGTVVESVEHREEMSAANASKFVTLWSYVMLRNADNGAHTLSLLHPSYGIDAPHDNVHEKIAVLGRYITRVQTRGVKVDSTIADLVDFWRAREEIAVDASYAADGYHGRVTTGAHAAKDFTLEFGDAITSFDCPSCGPAVVTGKRVVLQGVLPPETTFEFAARVTTPPAPVPSTPGAWLLALVTGLLFTGSTMRARRAGQALTSLACILSVAAPARAQEQSPYCTRVRERASDDATMLMSPRLSVQVHRFPESGQVDAGTIVGHGVQPRIAMSYSLLDLYKGFGVLRAGEADCKRHEASVAVEGMLAQSDALGRIAAFRAVAAYLRDHDRDIHGSIERAALRLSERAITLVEFEDIRERVDALDRRLAQVEGETKQLEAERPAPPTQSAKRLVRGYTQAAAELASAEAHVRNTEPFQLQVTGGIIPLDPFDWYGSVELSFNLGGVTRFGHGNRYVRARINEVEHAPDEVGARYWQNVAKMTAALEQARRELSILDRDAEIVARTRRALGEAEASNIAHERDRLALEEATIEADRAYFRALVEWLSKEVERG